MQVDQEQLERVNSKLNNQNALKAALSAGFWCMPILAFWYAMFEIAPKFAPLMLVLSGASVGFAVRTFGAGYGKRFALIALFAHFILVVTAFDMGIILTGVAWAIMPIGLYLFGAWAAAFFARKRISMDDHRAFYVLSTQQKHESSSKLKNQWFIIFPVLLIATSISTVFTSTMLYIYADYNEQIEVVREYEQEKERMEAKNIDVTPKSLDTLSARAALYYAYSYYNGHHMSTYGKYKGKFPHSPFKATTILLYLVEHRQEPRAAFILSRISEGSKSIDMLETAIKQGDEYAKLYSIIEYGCSGEFDKAKQLLQGVQNLVKEEPVKSSIRSVQDYGFEFICEELPNKDFELRFIREYTPR